MARMGMESRYEDELMGASAYKGLRCQNDVFSGPVIPQYCDDHRMARENESEVLAVVLPDSAGSFRDVNQEMPR